MSEFGSADLCWQVREVLERGLPAPPQPGSIRRRTRYPIACSISGELAAVLFLGRRSDGGYHAFHVLAAKTPAGWQPEDEQDYRWEDDPFLRPQREHPTVEWIGLVEHGLNDKTVVVSGVATEPIKRVALESGAAAAECSVSPDSGAFVLVSRVPDNHWTLTLSGLDASGTVVAQTAIPRGQ